MLLLDIGNTRIKAAVLESGRVKIVSSVSHNGCWTSVISGLSLCQEPESIHIASVVGSNAEEAISVAFIGRFGLKPVFYRAVASAAGVSNGYREASRLGVDRWMAIIAAYHRVRGAVCVVDCGTTITIDLVSASGQHQGGFIVPGLMMAKKSLLSGAKEVDVPEGEAFCSLSWGRSTEEAVCHGLLFSSLAIIERAFSAFKATDSTARLVLTGGDAAALAVHLEFAQTVPELVLEGIHCSATIHSGSKY
ncbi:MAG: type III pantothenate kinase [Gammaproteobacteria bacterium]|nr:type III pantothenate kinase [Gammaproteobacteria bacterium]